MIGHEPACAAKIFDPVWSCTCSPTMCADTHHVAELALGKLDDRDPSPAGKSDTVDGGSSSGSKQEIGATMSRLDALNEDERRVVQRVIDRLHVLHGALPNWEYRGSPALDEALLLELTDIRLEREAGQYRHEADRMEMSPFSGAERALMPARMRKARDNAGLSLVLAAQRIRPWPVLGPLVLDAIERGLAYPNESIVASMADVYGVTIAWLRGTDTSISPDTVEMLRDADISTDDRAIVTELIESVQGREVTPAPELVAAMVLPMRTEVDESGEVTLHKGGSNWHDGPGWYYTIDDYPDEGSCGAFASRLLAEQHARMAGHTVPIEGPTDADMIGAPDDEIVDGVAVTSDICDLATRIAAAGGNPSTVAVNPDRVSAALAAGLDVEIVGPSECQPSAPGAPYDPAPCGAADCFIAPVGGEG